MAKSIVGLISENLRESERDRHRSRMDLKQEHQAQINFYHLENIMQIMMIM